MHKNTMVLSFIISISLITSTAIATDAEVTQAKYIDVTLEIHGLEDSISALREASDELAGKLKAISEQEENFSADELQRMEQIAASMEAVAAQIDKTINSVGPTLREAKQPTVELVSAVVQEARVKGVDPVVATLNNSVNDAVSQVKWSLIWVGFVLMIGLGLFGFFMFKSLAELNGLTSTFREAFAKGEFTYRLRQDNE